jgi:hypothetical protein
MDEQAEPMLQASNLHYELAEKYGGTEVGGIGAIHLLVQRLRLAKEIDARLHLLKYHRPYHESDHVLTIAYNVLSGGRCLEAIQRERHNEHYLNALGAKTLPASSTAGDFCRRFEASDVEALMEAINVCRVRVWHQQPQAFFQEARIEADGTMVATQGECKEGMMLSPKGEWGYNALVISLANTTEVLYVVNRGGHRPSHEGAAERLDQAITLVRAAGFQRVTLRGDTDFSQTKHLDRWDAQGVEFVFGYDACPNLVEQAQSLPESAWDELLRPPQYEIKTIPRQKPEHVKEKIVEARGYNNLRLIREEVASFEYQPTCCQKSYRMVVLKKYLHLEKRGKVIEKEIRYFFYITNKRYCSRPDIVREANERCNQENLLAQLHGMRALHAPVSTLVSNWAYMVMASLTWTLKTWFALLLPKKDESGRDLSAENQQVLRMEFKTFLQHFIRIPSQIIRTGRKILYRLLAWNPWQAVFLRAVDTLHCVRLC